MDKNLTKIALTRLNVIPVVKGTNLNLGLSLNAELLQLGYLIDNWKEIGSLTKEEFNNIVTVLIANKGADVDYVPLFANFPDDVPDDNKYLLNRVLSFLGYELKEFNEWKFGADPISQLQIEELYNKVIVKERGKKSDCGGLYTSLKAVSYEETEKLLVEWVRKLLFSSVSVQEFLWNDCNYVLDNCDSKLVSELTKDFKKINVKETQVRLSLKQWVENSSTGLLTTPTDLLKLLALSRGQDVSLTKPVRLKGLKLSKAKRRSIMELLNKSVDLEEHLQQYRGLWLSIAAYLHPGDFAKRQLFNKVVKAFDDLRNKRLKSFESKVVSALTVKEKLELLSSKPSLLIRKLSQLGDDAEPYLKKAISKDDGKLSISLLLQARSALTYKDVRTVVNKLGKTYNVEPSKQTVSYKLVNTLDEAITNKLTGHFWLELESKKVWLDDSLKRVIIPLHERKKSEGLLKIARGTRIPLTKELLRVFVYWKQREKPTDLDLSFVKLDLDFKVLGHLAWDSYGKEESLKHSGDIISAPLGATEFVDINLARGFKDCYGAVVVIKFGGEEFSELESCHAGWMIRESYRSETKLFDPKTVQNKVEVRSDTKNWIPFIVDFNTNELIYVDIYLSGERTIQNIKHLPKLVEALTKYWLYRPTYHQLINYYLKANNAVLTKERQEADITIGVDDSCNINVNKLVGSETLTIFDCLVKDEY